MLSNIRTRILTVLILSFVLVSFSNANDSKIANMTITEQSIKISGNDGFSNITLSVSGPAGFYVQNFLGDGSVAMLIDDISSLMDGQYNYELTAATSTLNNDVQGYDNGRDNVNNSPTESASQSGSFLVSAGKIVVSQSRMNKRMMNEGDDQDEI